MRKAWLIARVTYAIGIRSSTFLMITFGLPLLMLASGGLVALQTSTSPLPLMGYVDESGELVPSDEIKIGDEILHLRRFPDVAGARSAQMEGFIEAYIVVPTGYLQGEAVRYYGSSSPSARTKEALRAFMRQSLLPDTPPATIDLLKSPLAKVAFVDGEGGSAVQGTLALLVRKMFPFLLAGLFGFLVTTNASQMGAAMVREKDQRSIEIVLTSLPAWQLVLGKVMAVTLISLTQILVWGAGAGLALMLAMSRSVSSETISIPLDVVVWALALFLPGYFLYSILAAGVGLVASNARQAQQIGGAFGVLAMTPFFMLMPIMQAPNGPLALGLSLFPLTAPMITIMRMGGTVVPTWQLLAATGLIILALLGSIWLVASLFRTSMLLYGQPLRLRSMIKALRHSPIKASGGRIR